VVPGDVQRAAMNLTLKAILSGLSTYRPWAFIVAVVARGV
jgi:hypothetical protein